MSAMLASTPDLSIIFPIYLKRNSFENHPNRSPFSRFYLFNGGLYF